MCIKVIECACSVMFLGQESQRHTHTQDAEVAVATSSDSTSRQHAHAVAGIQTSRHDYFSLLRRQ
jgi:hypothetical protein